MTVEGNVLTIRVDLSKEFGSAASGKTIIVASTEGNIGVPARRPPGRLVIGAPERDPQCFPHEGAPRVEVEYEPVGKQDLVLQFLAANLPVAPIADDAGPETGPRGDGTLIFVPVHSA